MKFAHLIPLLSAGVLAAGTMTMTTPASAQVAAPGTGAVGAPDAVVYDDDDSFPWGLLGLLGLIGLAGASGSQRRQSDDVEVRPGTTAYRDSNSTIARDPNATPYRDPNATTYRDPER